MVDFSHAISLVGEFAEAARFQQLSQVTSIIECPDQIPAIGFVELLHLLTTVFGTFRTSQPESGMSAVGGRAEVAIASPDFRV
jgi:hypothetical protein